MSKHQYQRIFDTEENMPPFRFPLQQVLAYREQLEQQAKVELARVEGERRREQQRVDDIANMLEEQENALRSLQADQMAERWLGENFIRGLREDRIVAMQRVRNWAVAVDAARKELTKRALDRKTLDKLKEKQAESHAKNELLYEQREFDEIASLRFKVSP